MSGGPFALDAVGRPAEARSYTVTEEAIAAYAAATDETAQPALEGRVAPPVFAIVPLWEAIPLASRAVAADEIRPSVVHYEQDMVLHRPIEPGMTLVAQATPVAVLPRPNGTSLVVRAETRDAGGELVNEQYVTEFFRGVEAEEGVGERAPDHRLEPRDEPPVEIRYQLATDQTERYADASGDHFRIHLDDEFARSVGLPGRIVHGLCTMAFTGRAVLEAAGVADPAAVRRLAVRFSAPLFPGETLTTRVWELPDGSYGFDALGGDGRAVIKDGRAELR